MGKPLDVAECMLGLAALARMVLPTGRLRNCRSAKSLMRATVMYDELSYPSRNSAIFSSLKIVPTVSRHHRKEFCMRRFGIPTIVIVILVILALIYLL